jgi:hypothetical protein
LTKLASGKDDTISGGVVSITKLAEDVRTPLAFVEVATTSCRPWLSTLDRAPTAAPSSVTPSCAIMSFNITSTITGDVAVHRSARVTPVSVIVGASPLRSMV